KINSHLTMLRQNFVFNARFAVWVPRLSAKAVRLTHDKNNKSDMPVVRQPCAICFTCGVPVRRKYNRIASGKPSQ
ncbi:MAG: hypothetical protein LBL79_04460, partial [Prevotella sp.]|nr:hypothetical protein [Prevotella sp.]